MFTAFLSLHHHSSLHVPHSLIYSHSQENGYTKEEMKVVWETIKIFGLNDKDKGEGIGGDNGDVRVSCTAVRVPVSRAHSEAITIETCRPITAARARYGFYCIKWISVYDSTISF